MSEINKVKYLVSLELKVKKHLTDAKELFSLESESSLLLPSVTGGWSVAQCLDHLNSYGNYYHPLIKHSLSETNYQNPSENFRTSFLGNYFTRMMDPATNKKKFKAFKGHIPAKDLDAGKVVKEFICQQEELQDYLIQARNFDLNKIRIPISITRWIKLSLGDVFQFIIAHNERHMLQAKKNLLLVKV